MYVINCKKYFNFVIQKSTSMLFNASMRLAIIAQPKVLVFRKLEKTVVIYIQSVIQA